MGKHLCISGRDYVLACEVWVLDEIGLPIVSHGLLRPCPRRRCSWFFFGTESRNLRSDAVILKNSKETRVETPLV